MRYAFLVSLVFWFVVWWWGYLFEVLGACVLGVLILLLWPQPSGEL